MDTGKRVDKVRNTKFESISHKTNHYIIRDHEIKL